MNTPHSRNVIPTFLFVAIVCICVYIGTVVRSAFLASSSVVVSPVPSSNAQLTKLAKRQKLERLGTRAANSSATPNQTVLVHFDRMFGKRPSEVSKIVGASAYGEEHHSPNEDYGFPNGSTEHLYRLKESKTGGSAPSFSVIFDTDGRAKSIQFIYLGELTKYTLEEWKYLLHRLGMEMSGEPDHYAAQGISWDSPSPYHIVISADETGHVRTIEIMLREIQDRGEADHTP